MVRRLKRFQTRGEQRRRNDLTNVTAYSCNSSSESIVVCWQWFLTVEKVHEQTNQSLQFSALHDSREAGSLAWCHDESLSSHGNTLEHQISPPCTANLMRFAVNYYSKMSSHTLQAMCYDTAAILKGLVNNEPTRFSSYCGSALVIKSSTSL